MSHVRQAQTGQDHVFVFRPSRLPSAAPSLRVVIGATDSTLAMSAVRVAASVTAVDASMAALATDATGAAARGLAGDEGGQAWLDLGAHGQYPVRVLRVDADGTVVLDEALPHSVPLTAAGSLNWNVWSVTIPAATIGAAVVRGGRWDATWVADLGADHPGLSMHDGGSLRVVRRPFSTGLTHDTLLEHVPPLRGRVPDPQESFQPQIDLTDMLSLVESCLPSNAFADMTVGEQWQRAHAMFVFAHLVDVGFIRSDDLDRPRALAEAELARQCARIGWLDLDDDGVVDDDEVLPVDSGLAGLITSHAPTLAAEYTAGTRYRPRLDNENDR
jgi:hypothetical protein